MASKALWKVYREVRHHDLGGIVGESALSAWRRAKILHKWRTLESLGFVRLVCEPDWDYDYHRDVCGCKNPKCRDRGLEAFGSIGQYCLPDGGGCPTAIDDDTNDNWFNGDSVWGHVGYKNVLDWRENPYILETMHQTVIAFRDAWKAQAHAYGRATVPALPAQ